MKHKMMVIVLAALSLLAVTQVEANSGVERTANTWLLTPASWTHNRNQIEENYPFDLHESKINSGDGDQARHYNNGSNQHPLSDQSVSSPVYQQKQ